MQDRIFYLDKHLGKQRIRLLFYFFFSRRFLYKVKYVHLSVHLNPYGLLPQLLSIYLSGIGFWYFTDQRKRGLDAWIVFLPGIAYQAVHK